MCEPVSLGLATGAQGALGAISNYQSGQAAADANNRAALRQYRQANVNRAAAWDRQRGLYQYKQTVYDQELQENNAAVQRAYQAEQRRLNDTYDQAAFSNQAELIQALSERGRVMARGVSGQSAARSSNAVLAALGRNQAIRAKSLASARDAYGFNNENTRLQAMSANNRAYSKVAMPPVAGAAPESPVMQAGPSGMSLMAGLGSAALSGYGAYKSMQAPPGFTNRQRLQQGYYGPAF